MHTLLSRRRFITSAAVGSFAPLLTARPSLAQGHTTGMGPTRLIIGRRTIEVHGRSTSVFGIQQADGTSGVVLDPDPWFHVQVENRIDAPTLLHWHGQTPQAGQDGVAETGYAPLIAPGENWTYDFAPRAGTHLMHALQVQQALQLMAAPLIVRTQAERSADMQDVVLFLQDFSFSDPAEIVSAVEGVPTASGRALSRQQFEYDAYLANDRTLDDPLVVRTERSGRVRLRIINGATSSGFWMDLGALDGTLIAVDGDPVEPLTGQRFPVAPGQRLDIIVRLPAADAFPVLALREGGRERTGIILAGPGASIVKLDSRVNEPAPPLDLSLERRLVATLPRGMPRPDITHRIALTGQLRPYSWSINNRTWSRRQPLRVAQGQRVLLGMTNRSQTAHTMHLHGHHFQIIAIDGTILHGAMRDSVLVPAGSSVTVAFDANNPGHWLLHCDDLLHYHAGMLTELIYNDAD